MRPATCHFASLVDVKKISLRTADAMEIAVLGEEGCVFAFCELWIASSPLWMVMCFVQFLQHLSVLQFIDHPKKEKPMTHLDPHPFGSFFLAR